MVDKNILKFILEKIKEYDNISLFFHELPDFDALGSCFALNEFIKDNFQNKTVKIVGLDTLPLVFGVTLFKFNKEKNRVTNNFLKSSIGIISDTANSQRIYTKKHILCKETIRVDHHPQVEVFADFEWIDPMMPATSEMWAHIFFNSRLKVSPECCKYLYAGILTDTGRFLHLNTIPSTYEITSKLVATGFKRGEVHDAIYSRDKKQIMFTNFIMELTKIQKNIAYFIIPKGSHKRFNITPQMSMVHLLSDIKGVKIWASLYYDEISKNWKGSIRSKDIQINHIASKFSGGGHKFAAGFTLKRESDFKLVLKEIKKYLNELIQNK
ncbi:MAG: bifunctional oligoribonuclease/PAP phosphatase NrnA [Malacoplasma sp.]